MNFYPRSPCGERLHTAREGSDNEGFLSTLSLRRATIMFAGVLTHHAHFYPRSPCGERLPRNASCNCHSDFYPRSPCGERRPHCYNRQPIFFISIHALLAESDESIGTLRTVSVNFYPRSPCGERPYGALKHVHQTEISIHALLAESDTITDIDFRIIAKISIHALLAESDLRRSKSFPA